MLKLGRVTKVKVFFPVLVHVFDIDLFEFSAAILEKGLLGACRTIISQKNFASEGIMRDIKSFQKF